MVHDREAKIQAFADLLYREQAEDLARRYPALDPATNCAVKIVPGKKYVKVDVGRSGKYMVDEDGNIWGIKAYGVIHRGHQYGTLDTIHDWYWGGYAAERRRQ